MNIEKITCPYCYKSDNVKNGKVRHKGVIRQRFLCKECNRNFYPDFTLSNLDKCRQAGERMVLLTACVPEFCQAAMERLGLTDYFERVIYVQELGVEKRDPRAFSLALEELGEETAGCTLYEDSPGVCRTAKEAGLTVVGVYDPFYAHYEDEMRVFCHRYIRSFTELL